MTEQVKNRKAVESSNRRLAELVAVLEQEREAKDRFFAGLSHDLRTPFAVAKSSAELLELLLPSESDLKQFTSVIKKNMDRADNMIKDLLYAKQIQSGEKIPLRVKKVELVGLIKETLANLAVIHGDRFILKGDSDVMGCWDPSLIRRAVENIVINAIKYGHEDLPITVIVNSTDNNASIKIHNFGEPISESDQQRIFQPNQRGQIETNLFPGWGLGLTLVVGITKAHNGTVALSSNRDDGTSFFLEIPLKS